jgi:hypothetical protein
LTNGKDPDITAPGARLLGKGNTHYFSNKTIILKDKKILSRRPFLLVGKSPVRYCQRETDGC